MHKFESQLDFEQDKSNSNKESFVFNGFQVIKYNEINKFEPKVFYDSYNHDSKYKLRGKA